MAAPAGPCEWCGGPQEWTVASGVMHVRCVGGCLSLFDEERVDFLPSSDGLERISCWIDGTFLKVRGSTRKGGETKESVDDELPF